MKYHIENKESYSLATITQSKSATVTAIITTDIHQDRTTTEQALHLMYGDALLSGAGKYTREEFLNQVNLLGATLSISVSEGALIIKLASTLQKFSKLLKLTELMLKQPNFPKPQIDRIKSTTINQLQEAKENSKAIAQQELRNTFYGRNDRKFLSEIDEIAEEIKSISVRQLKSLHDVAVSQPWTCSIAGEQKALVDFEKFIKSIKKTILPSQQILGIHQQKPFKQVAVIKNIPSRQNIDFSIGAPLPITLHHPDYIPLGFAIAVLGKWGGFTGRLMSTVRELEGLTYGIYSRMEGFTGTEQGYWQISTFFAPDKTMQGITSTFREIKNLYKDGITEEELDKFKTILQTQQTLLNDSVRSLLADLHAYHCQKFTLQEIKEHKARIETLTLDEVNSAIRTYLNPATLTVSCAGPTNSVKKEIQNFLKNVQ